MPLLFSAVTSRSITWSTITLSSSGGVIFARTSAPPARSPGMITWSRIIRTWCRLPRKRRNWMRSSRRRVVRRRTRRGRRRNRHRNRRRGRRRRRQSPATKFLTAGRKLGDRCAALFRRSKRRTTSRRWSWSATGRSLQRWWCCQTDISRMKQAGSSIVPPGELVVRWQSYRGKWETQLIRFEWENILCKKY